MRDQTTTAALPRAFAISTGLQLFAAFLIGGAIVFGVGFSHMSAVHNATHDVRHSTGFPCH